MMMENDCYQREGFRSFLMTLYEGGVGVGRWMIFSFVLA